MLCGYGCGREAKYPPKKGKTKWSCEEDFRLCPVISTLKSKKMKDKWAEPDSCFNTEEYRSNLKESVKKSWEDDYERRRALTEWNNEKWKDKDSFFYSDQRSNKIREKVKDIWKNEEYRKKHSEKISIGTRKRFPIEFFKQKYPFFSLIEEMRYNPEKISEIQVHCKYNECENSKENCGWFTPTQTQFFERLRQLEKDWGNSCGYFYCSQQCKDSCPLYGLQKDPYEIKEDKDLPYTAEEYQVFRDRVKQLDNSECQICGTEKDIHVHHIIPQKLEPFFALDPVNGICLCKECHFKYGHSDEGCKTNDIARKQCKNKKVDTK